MKKIIHVIYGLNIGGAETFIYNTLMTIGSPTEYQFDFAIQSHENKNVKLLNEIENKHGNVFFLPNFQNHPFRYAKELKKLVKDYDVVHFHNNALVNFLPFIYCKNLDAKVIVHSHNSQNNKGGLLGKLLHNIGKKIINNKKFIKVACSDKAANWMFNKVSEIIPNSVIVENYIRPLEETNLLRLKYNIGNNKVIGHVGRFVEAKNHKFIIKIFAEYIKNFPNTNLLLIGDGPLMPTIKQMTVEYGIEQKVCFSGNVSDPEKYYPLMDCLLFPSLFEGLPFTLVEAQASGVPIITSDIVTREVDVTSAIHYIPLYKSISYWVDCISDTIQSLNKDEIRNRFAKSQFNIHNSIGLIREIYS